MASVVYYTLFLACIFYLLQDASARKLPSFVHVCNRNMPKLDDCVKNSMMDIRPHLSKGIKQFRMPPLEPLRVMHAELDTGRAFKAVFNNILIHGLSDFIIKHVVVDFKNTKIYLDLVFPVVNITADYKLNGRLLILQLNGAGKSKGSYTDLETRALISGEKFTKKGKEYADFNNIELTLNFGRNNSLVFENIFRGNKELTDQTNKIISENIEGIMMEVKPVFDNTVSEIALSILRGVFDRFSLDELFPNTPYSGSPESSLS